MRAPSQMPQRTEPVIIDRASLLADVDASATLERVERVLAEQGLTLGTHDAPMTHTISAWLADGAKGARSPWADPADHLVAGFTASRVDGSGEPLVVHPSPRRAVGPDLFALVFAQRDRFFRVSRAWLRVHPVVSANAARALPFTRGEEPPVNSGESALFDAIQKTLALPGK